MSIDLIATGDGKETGYVSVNANTKFDVEAGTIAMASDDAFSVETETMNVNSTGRCEFTVGSYKLIEGGDAFTLPGLGNITFEQWVKAMAKVIGGG